jgi:hypothetical protein
MFLRPGYHGRFLSSSGCGEEALVEFAGGRAGGDAELIPQAFTQLAVNAESLS